MTRAVLLICALLCALPVTTRAQCSSARIETLCESLAEELVLNLQERLDRSVPVRTAPFADLHHVSDTSRLGRILAEGTGNAFSRHGYRVADTRAFMPTPFTLKETGETALSADPDQAGATSGMRTVLTGTYAPADGGVLISARIVRVMDHAVLSTATCRLALSEEVASLMAPKAPAAKAPPAPLLDLKKAADARRVQKALAAQGLYKAGIDGIWGRKSRAALARFRASIGLPATDEWDEATQKALFPAS
jgi:TolB-like protein